MTLLFNVTDAIGVAPNHGITRTERRLAGALLGRPDVHFVAVRDGRLWRVEDAAVERSAAIHDTELVPVTERFGVDPPPRSTSSTWSRIAARSVRRPAGPAISLSPCQVRTDDTLVSVGLDWVHGTIDVAERVVFGNGGRFVGMSYDLIPIDHPEWLFPPDPSGFRRYLQRLTRSAHRVLCISECTQRDLLRHAPDLSNDRAPVIRLGADAATTSTPDHDRFARSLFAGEPYAVYCATLDRRKNHEVLYRTMRRLVARGASGNLVFVGRTGSGVDDLVDCLRHDRSIAGRIAHVTDCDDPTPRCAVSQRHLRRVSVVVRRMGSRCDGGARTWQAVFDRERLVAR
jgi:glycosyltransferase involved in cell wall biosynthesis